MSESPDDKKFFKSILKEVTNPFAERTEKLRKSHQSAIDAIFILALKAVEQVLENCQKMMSEASTVIKELTPVATTTQTLAKPNPKNAKASEKLSEITTENQKKIDKKLNEIESKLILAP